MVVDHIFLCGISLHCRVGKMVMSLDQSPLAIFTVVGSSEWMVCYSDINSRNSGMANS